VGDLLRPEGRSMLNLLGERAYTVLMGVAKVARQRVFVVNAPETVREVLVECPRHYPKHRYVTEILTPLIGISLFNANGETWARQRRLVDQAFVQAGLRRAFPVMQAAVADLLARTASLADGRAWDVDAAMSHVTADIIFRTIFSTPLDEEQARGVHDSFADYQRSAQRVMGLSALHLPTFWHRARCRRMGAAIRASFAPRVRERFALLERGGEAPDDMLAALMAARDPETGTGLSEDEITDQIGTLVLAGHETSASTLAWALYLLACQPQLQQQVREEVARAWGGREPAFGDTRQLPLVQDVFRETLRLYPPIAFYLREAAADGRCLRGKPVAAGDMVAVSPWIVHRHRLLWERPDTFEPQRFRTEAGAASARAAWIPFGSGERSCPGAAFATQESVLILAQLVRRFRLEPVEGHTPAPVARLTLRSANGIRLRLRPLG
jgi:cytochrome P450